MVLPAARSAVACAAQLPAGSAPAPRKAVFPSAQRLSVAPCRRAVVVTHYKKSDVEEEPSTQPNVLERLASVLLRDSHTSLTRADASCAKCKGTGGVPCPKCGGSGVLKEKPHMDAVKHTLAKVSDMLHMPGATHSDWQITNRCMCCHGHGVVQCEACAGAGKRRVPMHAQQRK